MHARTLTRSTAATLLTAGVAFGLGAAPAHAASERFRYLCDATTEQGSFTNLPTTAAGDIAPEDDALHPEGRRVPISSVVVSMQPGAALRDVVEAVEPKDSVDMWDVDAHIEVSELPDMRVNVAWQPEWFGMGNKSIGFLGLTDASVVASVASPYTVRMGEFTLTYPAGETPVATLTCAPVPGQDLQIGHIHSFKGPIYTPTSTSTHTSSPAPSRPTVVQTDAEQPPPGDNRLPYAVAGLTALVAAGALLVRRRGTQVH
ncbi:hypothetical protein N802_10545 [Knoellia sinensis KCTC 19936]|uniref:Gram-positive cocci surface proteins LPxTG domain-containing protein n=1 Tax=Knoellia sinensis KCTC 19936 TaxID=1385520 RepID=A0A0A0J474_9MICO|nr:hypothetical protein [Knoellia sinensis]KGN32165.1 hypothetical protein N802_10545 [Knoellia sinensis KCTC 19936]